jgi:hypothetical protein
MCLDEFRYSDMPFTSIISEELLHFTPAGSTTSTFPGYL